MLTAVIVHVVIVGELSLVKTGLKNTTMNYFALFRASVNNTNYIYWFTIRPLF